jgi:hypothetical protein
MEYIDKIISSNDKAKMDELKKIYEKTLDYIKATDLEKYREIECSLYELVEGKKLSESKAKTWVSNMKPSAKWTIEDVKSVKDSYGVDIPLYDFYVLMNMMYTDYSDILGDEVGKYVDLSKSWYNDPDTEKKGSEKLYCYYKNIVI